MPFKHGQAHRKRGGDLKIINRLKYPLPQMMQFIGGWEAENARMTGVYL